MQFYFNREKPNVGSYMDIKATACGGELALLFSVWFTNDVPPEVLSEVLRRSNPAEAEPGLGLYVMENDPVAVIEHRDILEICGSHEKFDYVELNTNYWGCSKTCFCSQLQVSYKQSAAIESLSDTFFDLE